MNTATIATATHQPPPPPWVNAPGVPPAWIVEHAPCAIVMLDAGRRICCWNEGAEKLLGWPARELLGREAAPYLSPDPSHGLTLEQILRLARLHGLWSGDNSLRSQPGHLVPTRQWWRPLPAAGDPPAGWLLYALDRTEQHDLERQVLRTQRLENIGALACGIAHDLNNMLTPMLMAASLLADGIEPDQANRLLNMIRTHAVRGGELVRQILSFAGGHAATRAPLELPAAIREVAQLLAHTLPKGIELRTEVAGQLRPVYGDLIQIHQVLMNLCVNARDAMGPGGRLLIQARNEDLAATLPGFPHDVPPGRFVRLGIADSGKGIPPEILPRVFDPFFTTKGADHGTGLGLFTVRKLIREHGGYLRVESEPGRGTRFELFLPAIECLRPTAVMDQAPVPALPATGKSVLLVDDEPTILEVTARLLKRRGFEVFTATQGVEALSIFADHKDRIQVVIIDFMMPMLDGDDTITALRKINPRVQFVKISGLSEEESNNPPQSTVRFLKKPFSADKLLLAVQSALEDASSIVPLQARS